jgi:RNA polymerase sigma factor (sigma-70 family)
MDEITHDRIAMAYFTEVGQHDLPSKEEEVRLFTAYEKARDLWRLAEAEGRSEDAKAFNTEKAKITRCIAEGYVRFVIKQATRRTRDKDLLRELICAGNVGLMEAIPKFEVKRGFRFLTYAAWWINVHMQEHMNRSDAVHVPNHTRKEIRKRKKAEEAAAAAGLPVHNPIEEPSVGPLDPSAHIDPRCDTEATLHEKERDMLKHMHAANLPHEQRLILLYYYGLREAKSHTFGELSQLLFEIDGSYLPSEKIRQIKERGLNTLRAHLHSKNILVSNDLL